MWSYQCTSFEMLDTWADVSDVQAAQYCHNELGNTLPLAHITTGKYLACYSYDFIIKK